MAQQSDPKTTISSKLTCTEKNQQSGVRLPCRNMTGLKSNLKRTDNKLYNERRMRNDTITEQGKSVYSRTGCVERLPTFIIIDIFNIMLYGGLFTLQISWGLYN